MKRIDDWLTGGKVLYTLAIIVFISSLLRLYHINYQSLWYDELFSIISTDPQYSLAAVIEYCKSDQPPLFFIYVHYLFTYLSYDETVGRVACALIGVASIPCIYLLGKECQGKAAGIFASLLTGINYFHIYYSQELRFYSMAFLFSTLSYLFFIRAFKRPTVANFFGYSLFTICLLYTQYFGLIIFGTQALTFLVLVFYRRDLRFVLLAILSGTIVVLALIPWLPVIMNDLGADLLWIKSPEPFFVAQYFYDYTGKDALTTALFLLFIYLFAKPLVKRSMDREVRLVHFILIIWIVISYLVPYLRSILMSPILHNRYTIVTLPAWIVIFGIGWDYIGNKKWKYAIPLILFLSFSVNMVFFKKHYSRIQKTQFREASEIVLANNGLRDPVYSSLSWHFNFYFRKEKDRVIDMNTANLSGVERFWFLQAHYSAKEMDDEINKLTENFKAIETHQFYEARAILMVKK